LPELVDAAEDDFARLRGFSPGRAAIVVTHGAIGGLSCVFQRLLNPGDEVLVPTPIWPAIPSLVKSARAVPVPYRFATPEDAQRLPDRLPALSSPRTRMLVLNAPSNPSGITFDRETLACVLAVAAASDIQVVFDDAYESLGCEGPDTRLLDASIEGAENVILLCSMSKRFAAPALRVGIVRAPAKMGPELWDECLLQTGGVSRIAQAAAASLLRNAAAFEEEVATIVRSRRAAAVAAIGTERLLSPADGSGLYLICRAPPGCSGWLFAREALARGVGMVPGEVFGIANAVRISLTVDEQLMTDVGACFARASGMLAV
jgi:aspartate/methionine/tyrosine aminotransferase